jgi:hypothetical protein
MWSPTARAVEHEIAGFLTHSDQGEVGGTAAHVAHQDAIADSYLLAPVRVRVNPGVESGLRFFQQGQLFQTHGPSGFHGQVASRCIKRCRHGQNHILGDQRFLAETFPLTKLPGFDEMLQIAATGFHRRNATDSFGGLPGQDRRSPVHTDMNQPRLRRTDQPRRHPRAQLSRQFTDRIITPRVPGQL